MGASRSVFFDIIGRDRASDKFDAVGRSAQRADKKIGGFGSTLKSRAGKLAALTGVSLGASALLGFAKSAVDTEKSYSTSMRSIRVATGATGRQMNLLNKQAIDLGQKTVYSAGDAADAMLELGKAGMHTSEIMRAVPQVMNLAATEGMGLADAAGVVTSGLAEFGIKAKNTGKLVNALAGASIASKGSVSGLAQSLSLVGGAAHGMGMSVQETAGALAALAQGGLEGSIAGTSLASVLNHLQPQTETAAGLMDKLGISFTRSNGTFKSMTEIAGILQDKLGGLSPALRQADISGIFGRDASTISAVNSLITAGAKGLRSYTKAASDQGAAQKLAKARMDGTAGALEQLSGSIDTAKLKLGQELAPAVIKGSNYLAGHLVPAMDDGIAASKELGKALDATVVPPLKIAGKLALDAAKFFDGLPGPLKSAGLEAGIAALVFPRLAAGVSSVTTAVGFNIARLQQFRAELSYTETRGAAVSTMLGKLGGAARLAAGIGGMLAITQASKTANQSLKDMENAAGMAATGFATGGLWGAAIGGGIGLVQGLVHTIKESTSATKTNYSAIGKTASLEVAKQAYGDLRSSLNETTGAYTKNTRAAIENWLQTTDAGKKVRAQLAGKGVNDRTIIESVLGNPAAIARTSTAFKASLSSVNAQLKTVAGQMKGMSAVDLASTDQGKALMAQAAALVQQKTELVANRGAFTGYVGTLKQAARDQRNFHDATEPVLKLLHLTKKAYNTTFSKRVRGELTLDGVPKTLAGIKDVATKAHGLTRREWKVLLKTAGVDTTTKQFNNLVKVGTDTGKKTGDHWWQNVSSSIAGGQPKTTSAMKTLLSGAGNGSSRVAALVGRSGGLTITTSMASQIRAGRGPVVASIQYLMSEARRAAGGSGGGGGGGGGTSAPHGAQRTVGRGMVGSLRAAVNASTFKGIGKSAVSAFLQGFDDDSQNRADRVADKLRDAISKAIRSKKNKDGISKAAADTMRDAVNAMMKQADAMRGQLSKRLDFKNGLLSSFKGELDLGSMIGEDGTLTSGMLQGGITALATRLRNFAGQLGDLAKAHFPKGLISEVANLGSDQGSTVASALLSSSGSGRGDLITAYNSYSAAASSAATAGANAYYGTPKQIRQEFHFHFSGRALATKSDIGKEVYDSLREYERQTGNKVVSG